MEKLPKHLRKYIVEQSYEKYTPVHQASWRFVLRQLKAFLAKHAHESYLDGLKKTGIELEEIPRIQEMSKKLESFGWRALPVSGFIPPAAFMELQSMGILPIASDMRSIDHLMYTPAPDIVHEAAGHAPILINREFADYLRAYAQVAKKAIISSEDMALYEAIRILSDVKENPSSAQEAVDKAQKNLDQVSKSLTFVSEAAQLGRMNWWTAEYGLIGELNNPKIFGAGLLSSVGESKWCLSDKVKKIPISKKCVEVGYDITEPQPQLFVTPDFQTLKKVLNEFAETMAFKTGGKSGLEKSKQAKTINAVQLNSGIQISGVLKNYFCDSSSQPCYLQFSGPSQLAFAGQEIAGHSKSYHRDGFGTALGYLKSAPTKCLSIFSEQDLQDHGLIARQKCNLEFASGVTVNGTLMGVLRKADKIILLSFSDCTVKFEGKTLFQPDWGVYDMAVGSWVVSVFGGPADRESYGEIEDFVAARVPLPNYSDAELKLQDLYQQVRSLRVVEAWTSNQDKSIEKIWRDYTRYTKDWLLNLEIYELILQKNSSHYLRAEVEKRLREAKSIHPNQQTLIDDGMALAEQP